MSVSTFAFAQQVDKPADAQLSDEGLVYYSEPKPLALNAVTQDWPSFLGPDRNGISKETPLIKGWHQDGPKLVWEMRRGSGYASPVVMGDRLVMFHRVDDEEIVDCVHAETGRRVWRFSYPCRYEDRYKFSGGPRSTPIIDGASVYTYGVEGKLHCLDLSTGSVRWKRDVSAQFKVPQDFFGVGNSPLIEGDLLIINVGAPSGPCVVALDKKTGETVWSAGDQWGPSYASPVGATIHGSRRVLVFAGGDSEPPTGGLLSIDPLTGRIATSFAFRSKSYTSVNAATPVVVDDRVFLSTSYGKSGVLLRLDSGGGHKIVWRTKELGSHFPTPIHRGGYLYGFDGSGKHRTDLVCLELESGKLMWRAHLEWEETITRDGEAQKIPYGVWRGSMIVADGRFICLGEDGHLLILELSPQGHKELARVRLFSATESWTPPVLSRGLLYICQNTPDYLTKTPPRLLCYDLRG